MCDFGVECESAEEVLIIVERLREELFATCAKYERTSSTVLQISQQLDKLLNLYHSLLQRDIISICD